MSSHIVVRHMGLTAYEPAVQAMREFTDARQPDTPDELWVVEHPPVYTLGQAADLTHLRDTGSIAVVQSDRGGQVTYHGPGQLIVYVMVDLRRRNLGVRSLVELLENSVIELLDRLGIESLGRRDAPGVYVDGSKIAALGLRVRRGCSFHGLALNVSMDLEPYNRINPCGYAGLQVTQVCDLGVPQSVTESAEQLVKILISALRDTDQRAKKPDSDL